MRCLPIDIENSSLYWIETYFVEIYSCRIRVLRHPIILLATKILMTVTLIGMHRSGLTNSLFSKFLGTLTWLGEHEDQYLVFFYVVDFLTCLVQ